MGALLVLAALLVTGCGDFPADEPDGGSEVGAAGALRSGTGSSPEASAVAAAEAESGTAPGALPDTAAIVVRDGRLVNRVHDFSLDLPVGVTLAQASPRGDAFTLDRDGARFLYAAVERASTLEPAAVLPGTDPGRILPLERARAACAADGLESSLYCTGPVRWKTLEFLEVFTLRHVREDRGHEGPTRVTLGEAGPFYWIAFDPGLDALGGLLVHGPTDAVMDEKGQAAARALLVSWRRPAEGPGPGGSADDPVAPLAVLTLDGAIPVYRAPRESAEQVDAIGPMTVIRTTGRLEVERGPEEIPDTWYEVETGDGRGWVRSGAAFYSASWDGRRLLFRSGSTVDASTYYFLTDRKGASLGAFRVGEGELLRLSPSLERYAVLKREPGAREGTLEVHDPVHRVLVHGAWDVRSPRWDGETIRYEQGWEQPETEAIEFGEVAFDPPAVPGAGTRALLLTAVPALDGPEIMMAGVVARLGRGELVETTGAAEGATITYGDAGSRSGLWLEVRTADGAEGWVPAETLGYLVEDGENGLFEASTHRQRRFVRGRMDDPAPRPFGEFQVEEGERLDCYEDNRACFVDHGGDLSGTFTLFHGPTGEEVFHAEYVGRPPYWVREETVAYLEIAGGITEEGWIPADYEEVRGRR